MNHSAPLGFPEAARRLGVPLRVLRRAIRDGKIPAPPQLGATAVLSAGWFDSVAAAVEASPRLLNRTPPQKVPPFARYEGTSAWRKYRNRVREHTAFHAKAELLIQAGRTAGG
jgi:hypothetical protein